jgi:hypothetical protein
VRSRICTKKKVCSSLQSYTIFDYLFTEPAGEYTLFCVKRNENHELVTGFLCIRESYQQLRGLSLLVVGCHI